MCEWARCGRRRDTRYESVTGRRSRGRRVSPDWSSRSTILHRIGSKPHYLSHRLMSQLKHDEIKLSFVIHSGENKVKWTLSGAIRWLTVSKIVIFLFNYYLLRRFAFLSVLTLLLSGLWIRFWGIRNYLLCERCFHTQCHQSDQSDSFDTFVHLFVIQILTILLIIRTKS